MTYLRHKLKVKKETKTPASEAKNNPKNQEFNISKFKENKTKKNSWWKKYK